MNKAMDLLTGKGQVAFLRQKPNRRLTSFCTYLVLLLSTFVHTAAVSVHEYHVSVANLQYNPALKSFEVSIRIFTDDLEKALSAGNGDQHFTIKNDDPSSTVIGHYVLKSFALVDSQKKPASIQFLGKEQEEDATWIYLEIPFQGTLDGYRLQNSVLMEVFEDQVNMTNIKYKSDKKTLLFKKGQTVHLL